MFDLGNEQDYVARGEMTSVAIPDSANRQKTGSERLCQAILEQAIADLKSLDNQESESAERWIFSDDRRWQFSFLNCCDILDLPASAIRAKVRDGEITFDYRG